VIFTAWKVLGDHATLFLLPFCGICFGGRDRYSVAPTIIAEGHIWSSKVVGGFNKTNTRVPQASLQVQETSCKRLFLGAI
jgi:hypothetical protein